MKYILDLSLNGQKPVHPFTMINKAKTDEDVDLFR